MRMIAAVVAAVVSVPALAQGPAKPGAEHALLKKREGTWDITMKYQGGEFKGTVMYKMELGGLWLCGSQETDLGGMKYHGKSLETYDAGKKKYTNVWADSMGTESMHFAGDYDVAKKTLTLVADGMGMDGKPAKWKSVSAFPDDNTIELQMFVGDGKEPMFTVTYKRKK